MDVRGLLQCTTRSTVPVSPVSTVVFVVRTPPSSRVPTIKIGRLISGVETGTPRTLIPETPRTLNSPEWSY